MQQNAVTKTRQW